MILYGCAGDDTYSGSSTSAQITVGPESSSTSLVGTLPGGVATEDATIVITLTSGGPGMPRLPGRSIFVDFGDGSDISTPTDGAGSLVLKHPYATAGLKTLVATFPGDNLPMFGKCLCANPTFGFMQPVHMLYHILALSFAQCVHCILEFNAIWILWCICSHANSLSNDR